MGDNKVNIIKTGIGKKLILVEYPGLVKNDDKMIKTLGGLNKISRVFSNEKRRLELRYHPDNIYNKPAMGDSTTASGLFIKVKIKRPKDPNQGPMTHTVEILGKCAKKYHFNSLCDFQYLPLQKDPQTNKVSYIYDDIAPKNDCDIFCKPEAPLFCTPFVFTKNDTVNTKIHRSDKDQKHNLGNEDVIGIARTRTEGSEYVSFNLIDPFPEKPNPFIVKKLQIKYISDAQFEKVRQLFAECPIWNRIALIYESEVSNDKLKVILPSMAYYFTTGPWRTMYVRYGYDPRKDFQSRLYQTFDFRYRFKTGIGSLVKSRSEAISEVMKEDCSNSNDSLSQPKQNVFYPYFEEGQLPRSRQCIFRYCDLRIAKVQEMLKRVPSPASGAICNEKTGWLPSNFNDDCRQIISDQIMEHIKSMKQKAQIIIEDLNESRDVSENEDYEEEGIQEEFENEARTAEDQMDVTDELNLLLET
ncbi:general transcription factor 3C polypeptide 5 [Condylostylus longicornis]|uniref:general transcription factor 3C polypeptide 5 n=1 Tax=Condylostylus longicornis TaxID=2530218 RepID=UPI00244E3298|nr:general transcription factor 3C polypeptide 5 [Condylostylus longicornis]